MLDMSFSLPLDSESLKSYEAHLSLQKNRSPHTVRAYMQLLRQLAGFAEVHGGDAITVVRDFTKDAAAASSKATQAQRASALKNYIAWCPGLDTAAKAQLNKHVRSPRIPRRVPRILELADLEKILAYIAEQNETEQILFYLLYGSGLRISEALGAEWSKFHPKTASLKIMGKGAKERIVPVVGALVKLLQGAPSRQGLLVAGAPSERAVRSWVRRWGRELGLEEKTGHWHPHKLRHSIASHLLQMGAKVPQIQKLLGHEQLATTEKYTHINPADLLKIYKKTMPLT